MNAHAKALVAAVFAALCLFASVAAAAEVEVLWLGHATTRITLATGKVIVIDPFLTKNPNTPEKFKDLKALGKVDLILITHGHGDHVKDLPELARLTGAKVVGAYGFVHNLGPLDLVDGKQVIGMNKGGTVTPLGPDIKVHMVKAEHGSDIDLAAFGIKKSEPGSLRFVSGGVPVGYVVELENGFKIYHSGDTAVFGDMALIREFYKPDLAMVSIGGWFTMDSEGAAYAVRELIEPKQVIPIHYATYPVLVQSTDRFKKAMAGSVVEVLDVKPGESLTFK